MSCLKRFEVLCQLDKLDIHETLNCGQSFRWHYDNLTSTWIGVFAKTVWSFLLKDGDVSVKVLGSLLINEAENNDKDLIKTNKIFMKMLHNYFRLDVDLNKYFDLWCKNDESLFSDVASKHGARGIRLLCQEPVENLFSFICSQNNNIPRISSMVEKLCKSYGQIICEYDGKTYYAFPELEKLCSTKVESELREMGFGYRAKFIQKAAAQIVEFGGEKWFKNLQSMNYEDARQELIKLPGVGPKVADCVCLMSLNHLEAVPVDTHVYQIAAQYYLTHLKGKKNVTDKMYAEIGDHFRKLFGNYAGWAQTILFCADLKKAPLKHATNLPENKQSKKKKL